MYKGWDCHAYTPDCRTYVQDLLLREPDLGKPMSPAEISALFTPLLEQARGTRALAAVQKMRQRSGAQGYQDPQLPNLNIARLLELVHRRCEDRAVLIETLSEIGGTCVQGDSHRLLMLCAALESFPLTEGKSHVSAQGHVAVEVAQE